MSSFTRQTALSAMSLVSDRWSVEVRWFHDKSSHALPKSIDLSVYLIFDLCDDSNNLTNFFHSHVKILFCTDKIESIEWQDLASRLRIGDCFEIHLPRWGLCDQSLSSLRTFLHEIVLRQYVFYKDPLSFWFSSRRRNFELLWSEF